MWVKSAPNRDTEYPPSQEPHMWSGSYPSQKIYPAKGLYGGYYCEVRVTSKDCISFHEEYVWDTSQSKMNISVPKNLSFTVKVVFFEVCGDFYKNSIVYYETEWKWVSPEYRHPPPRITTGNFSYEAKKQCT